MWASTLVLLAARLLFTCNGNEVDAEAGKPLSEDTCASSEQAAFLQTAARDVMQLASNRTPFKGNGPCFVIEDKSDPYHSSLCKCWEDKIFSQQYPNVTYSVCEKLYDFPEFSAKFRSWMKEHKKEYANETIKWKRFGIFAANYVFTLIGNQTTDYDLDIDNEFADLSPEEFHATHLGLINTPEGSSNDSSFVSLGSSDTLPRSLDWDARGAVNTPGNQGNVNSCWAFATAGAIEGGWFARNRELLKLSPQQFVDCTGSGLTAEKGGNLRTPLGKVAKWYSLCSDRSYPYTKGDDPCVQDQCSELLIHVPQILGYTNVQSNNELALKSALFNTGPVGSAIDAHGTAITFYSKGVLTAPCSNAVNHAILVVGYGITWGTNGLLPYWKIKNSWGKNWGEKGFFRIERGKSGTSQCGILEIPTYPKFADALDPTAW